MNNSGIYQILNTVNNKRYIGSSVNIKKRWWEHRNQLRNNKHHSVTLQRAFNKYGEEAFKFEVLQLVDDPNHLLAYEQSFLDYFKSYKKELGYNVCSIAGNTLGRKHSEESKHKMSEARRNSGKGYFFCNTTKYWTAYYYKDNKKKYKYFKTEQEAIDFVAITRSNAS